TATVQIVTQSKPNAVLVPRRAVQSENGESYVLIPKDGPPDTQNKRPANEHRKVTLGLSNSEFIEIAGGLQPGEKVLVQDVVQTLRGNSLSIDEREMVAIMGASGSGKSTLMNIIGCLDQPSDGTYLLDEVDVGALSDNQLAAIRNQKIGFVFQQYMLLQRTSALRNVEMPLLYGGGGDRRARAEAALRAVGMGDRLHHKPNEL